MPNGNPFYVHPGFDIAPGLAGFGQAMRQAAEVKRRNEAERKAAEKYATMKAGAVEAFQSGDPAKIAEFTIQNPEMTQAIKTATAFYDKTTEESYKNMLFDFYSDPTESNLTDLVTKRQEMLRGKGVPADRTVETDTMLERFRTDPEITKKQVEMEMAFRYPTEYKAMRSALEEKIPGVMEVAGIKEFEYLTEGLAPEEIARARRVKLGISPRASEEAAVKAEKAFATESGKLQARLGLSPQIAGATAAAKNQAKIEADERVKTRSDQAAWEVYNSSMSNLAAAMGQTKTGPVIGFLPAITANAQIAEGSVAVMAPVLKQMFRTAGEGTFTDKDQELLIKMVPTRTDHPEARIAKIKAIDTVVRAKLGVAQETGGMKEEIPEAPAYTEGQTAIGPGGQKIIYRNGRWEKI